MDEKILVLICVDSSEHSMRAFNWFHRSFYRDDHKIGIVHIHPRAEVPSFGKHNGDPNEVLENVEYQKRLEDILKKSSAVTQQYEDLCTQRGMDCCVFEAEKIESVGSTICKIAKENNAIAVVMGQRGLGTIKRTIFGSVSDYVLHHAHLTVLVVPPPKDKH